MRNTVKIFFVLVCAAFICATSCKKDYSLEISVDPGTPSVVIREGTPLIFKYNVTSATGAADVKVEVSDNITLTHMPSSNGLSGSMILVLNEEGDNSFAQIIATNEGNTMTYRVELEMETVTLDGDSEVKVSANGGEFSLGLKSNVEYEVEISKDAQEWLTYVPDTKVIEHFDVVLRASANQEVTRHATVTVRSKTSDLHAVYTVSQAGVLNNIRITYGAAEVFGPTLLGSSDEANTFIYWGDGAKLKYSPAARHIYTDSASIHEAEVHTKASDVEFTSLVGVRKINFTDF